MGVFAAGKSAAQRKPDCHLALIARWNNYRYRARWV